MRKVTKDEFYGAIYSGRLNVHPTPTGNYPYLTIWKYLDYSRHGQIFGKDGNGEYYLAA